MLCSSFRSPPTAVNLTGLSFIEKLPFQIPYTLMAMFLIGFVCCLYTLNLKELAEVERLHPKKIEISYVRSHRIKFGVRKLCIPDQSRFLKDGSQSDNTKFHRHKKVTYHSRRIFHKPRQLLQTCQVGTLKCILDGSGTMASSSIF